MTTPFKVALVGEPTGWSGTLPSANAGSNPGTTTTLATLPSGNVIAIGGASPTPTIRILDKDALTWSTAAGMGIGTNSFAGRGTVLTNGDFLFMNLNGFSRTYNEVGNVWTTRAADSVFQTLDGFFASLL